jgi:diguanylate cyclase (GGDEF)-like protein
MTVDSEYQRLSTENAKLQQQLDTLMAQLRDNEATLRALQRLELEVLGCTHLGDLLRRLLITSPRALQLRAAGLLLIPPAVEIAVLLENGDCPAGVTISLPEDWPSTAFDRITLGDYQPYHRILFPVGRPPETVALMPLWRGHVQLGWYALGGDSHRFTPDQGTDFLGRLAMVVSTCLDNAINHVRLEHMALSDPLTGLDNRRAFDRRLAEKVAQAERYTRSFTGLLLDIDHFKPINDTYGHPFGDRALVAVAKALTQVLRTGDVVARVGGEEFALLLDETRHTAVAGTAERLRQAITAAGAALTTEALTLTASLGVAYRRPGETGESLMARADAALYQAKQTGRNRVVFAADNLE